MYLGSSDTHTALAVEHTFLLCKPDADLYHRHILQMVSDAGFQILAKSFIITPALAEEIASTFQSVQRRMHAERGTDKIFSKTKSISLNTTPSFEKHLNKANRSYFSNNWGTYGSTHSGSNNNNNNNLSVFNSSNLNSGGGEEDSDDTNDCCGKLLDCDCDQMETHQGIMAEIIRLTRRHGNVEEGVNAGLLPNADSKDSAGTDVNNLTGGDGRPNDGDMQSDQKTERRVATAAVLKNTMIEAMSYQDLLKEHVRHLAYGGTCLALELSGQNAVERLLEIVGPENPVVARSVAPSSIRARFGKDLIHNAVHAAGNLLEASHCISAVFGFTTQYSAADIRTNAAAAVADGIKSGEREKYGPAVVRPHCELVCVPHAASLTLGGIFRVERTNPQAHISYYTGEQSAGETTGTSVETTEKTEQEDVMDGPSWQQRAEELEKRVEQEWNDLMTHAKLLQIRELDLLLREHAIEKVTCGLRAPAQPVKRGGKCRSQQDAPSQLTDENAARRGTLSPKTPLQLRSLPFVGTTKDMLPSQGPADPLLSPTKCQVLDNSMPFGGRLSLPVISAEDVSVLLSKSVRLRALYVALQHFSRKGTVMREDIVALYNRSPAIQLLWADNHQDFFKNYLKQNIEEPVSFDSFVMVLMFLFKQ